MIKKGKVNFKFLAKTNEAYISVRYGCITFIDSYILSTSLDKLVKNLDEDVFMILKKEFLIIGIIWIKRVT